MGKRMLAFMITICMVLTMLPATAFAGTFEVIDSGSCGKDVVWTLTGDGVLTISGKGQMDNYYSWSNQLPPWYGEKENITQVIVEDGVTSIGYSAFEDCGNLTAVRLPEYMKNLGIGTFRNCGKLVSIDIPKGITRIYSSTFYNCSSLKEVVIPEGVVEVGAYSFAGCSSLEEIVIPSGVTKIGERAFSGCSSLKEVVIPSGVTGIESMLFLDCSSLERVVIPESVTKIETHAFSGCSNLKEAAIPAGVTEIGDSAFYNCSSLEQIVIPVGVAKIQKLLFAGCSSLANVVIPFGVTEIDALPFNDCVSLKQLLVPESVIVIAKDAFYGGISFVGVKGSAIEAYANENNRGFTEHVHKWDDGNREKLECTEYITYTCSECLAKDVQEIASEHRIVSVESVQNTCTEDGNIAYFRCENCGKLFCDENGTQEIFPEDVVIEELGHRMVKEEAKTATCEEAGNIEYYRCETCGKTFRDEEGIEEISLEVAEVEKLGHTIVKVEAKAETCEEGGNIEYYRCETCGKSYRDEAGEEEIPPEAVSIEKLGHRMMKTEEKAATCEEEGNIEYYRCEVCGKVYRDEEGKEEISIEASVVKKLGHSMVWVEAKAATCDKEGNRAYYRCENCGKAYQNYAGTHEISLDSVRTQKTGHFLTKTYAIAATCTRKGNIAYWKCLFCEKLFGDEDATKEITIEDTIIGLAAHDLTYIKAENATCTEDGMRDFYLCYECGKKFSDKSGKNELTDVKMKALGHRYTDDIQKATLTADGKHIRECELCGYEKTITTYYRPGTIKLSKATFQFNGKGQAPKVIIKDRKGKKIPASNYTVSYSKKKSKSIGKYKVTIRFKGEAYSGRKTLYYTIVPANLKLSSVISEKNGQLTVKWNTKKGVDGYQIRYSQKKNMAGSKTKTVKGVKNRKYVIPNLAGGKKYYVQVRAYKKVSGKTYYGNWSKKKSGKTSNIKLNYSSLNLEVGQTRRLKLTGTGRYVNWSSSNSSVVSVDSSGNITAVAAGNAKITAVCDGVSYSCSVTVKEKPQSNSNFDILYNYIAEYGSLNSSGDYFIKTTYYANGINWTFGIVYERSLGQFKFICNNSDATITMKLGRNGSTTTKCEFIYSGKMLVYCGASAVIDVQSYTGGSTLSFDFESYSGASRETFSGLANTGFTTAMAGWSMLLLEKVEFTMSGLGFTSYS